MLISADIDRQSSDMHMQIDKRYRADQVIAGCFVGKAFKTDSILDRWAILS